MLEGSDIGVLVGATAVLDGVLVGIGVFVGVLVEVLVSVGGTAVSVDVGVGVLVGDGVAVLDGVTVGGKGMMLTGVSELEIGVPVARKLMASSSDSAAIVASKGANSKS